MDFLGLLTLNIWHNHAVSLLRKVLFVARSPRSNMDAQCWKYKLWNDMMPETACKTGSRAVLLTPIIFLATIFKMHVSTLAMAWSSRPEPTTASPYLNKLIMRVSPVRRSILVSRPHEKPATRFMMASLFLVRFRILSNCAWKLKELSNTIPRSLKGFHITFLVPSMWICGCVAYVL